MRTRPSIVIMVALIAGFALSLTSCGATAVQSGTWKMDPAKSKFEGPTPKSATLKIEANDNEIMLDGQGVGAEGQSTHTEFSAKFDGKDYPATGLPVGDHVSVKRVNANAIQVTMKQNGQPVMMVTSVVSKDGKTRTSTYSGKNAQGHEVHTVVVYDRE